MLTERERRGERREEDLDLLEGLVGGDALVALVVGLEQAPLLLVVLLLLLGLGRRRRIRTHRLGGSRQLLRRVVRSRHRRSCTTAAVIRKSKDGL